MNREQVLREADRRRRQARVSTRRGDLAGARQTLNGLIDLLQSSIDDADDNDVSTSRSAVAKALADAYGMLGGVERRDGELDAALEAYRKGMNLEQDPAYSIIDSYNLVNFLVVSILALPEKFEALREQVQHAADVVADQVRGERRDQWWAWADYALLSLLTDDEDTAAYAYERFARCGPGPSDYRSVGDVLRTVSAALHQVDERIATLVSDAQDDLEARASERAPNG
jgi:tetratricopeptide (TPR) repeat protein